MAETVKYSRLCKEMIEDELRKKFSEHQNFIITECGTIAANDMNSFRRNAEKADSSYVVVKNRLCKRVMKDLKMDELIEQISSQCAIAFLGGDLVVGTKTVMDFAKENEPFKIKAGLIEGKQVGVAKLKELASLPSREMLLTMLVSTLQAPISGFVRALNGISSKFVYAIQAIKEKKATAGTDTVEVPSQEGTSKEEKE